MDGAGVTVTEAWVKAKVVCRKKGVHMVSSPMPPPPPPPIFPHDRNLHHADSLKLRLSTSNIATETDKGVVKFGELEIGGSFG